MQTEVRINLVLCSFIFQGLLQCEDGSIIKPCHSPTRGARELKFYQTIFDISRQEDDILELQKIVPGYLGLLDVPEHPDGK